MMVDLVRLLFEQPTSNRQVEGSNPSGSACDEQSNSDQTGTDAGPTHLITQSSWHDI